MLSSRLLWSTFLVALLAGCAREAPPAHPLPPTPYRSAGGNDEIRRLLLDAATSGVLCEQLANNAAACTEREITLFLLSLLRYGTGSCRRHEPSAQPQYAPTRGKHSTEHDRHDPVPQTGATKNGMEAVTHLRHSRPPS